MALCPACGEENPDRAKFCLDCGAPLATAGISATEERKIVSILFVDLVGFTARSHAADPEDVKAALVPYHSLLKREIERFGGTVEKFIGDAVMAVFGAPVAHEDDAERAVRAALRVIDAIGELNQDSSLDLSIRGAINSGEALITLTARAEAGESLVAGDVVNTASRLQNVAPVNGLVVGEMTYRSTKSVINYEELTPVTVKGKPEPVALWRALSARSRFGVDSDITSKTPFIGRGSELTTLKTAYRRAIRDSSLQLVAIVGEPGVGKSRLLAEFSSFVDEQEELILWRQGRSLPYGEGITFWALGEIVKAQAGILDSDDSHKATAKLRATIAAAIGEASEQAWLLTRLGPLVGVDISPGGIPAKEESFTAWRRFLEAIAERRPLVLVFEDLHWADPALLEFIEYLVDWVSGVAMLVVCTARPELYDKHPKWGAGNRNLTVIGLSPLRESETAQLISSLLSQAVLPAEIQAVLLDRAGGNPLYAEEFVHMLSDQGILRLKGGSLSLPPDTEIPVPGSVHALIAARLDTLSPEHKSLLQDASVVGKIIWPGAVAAIGGMELRSVLHDLQQLVSKQLVRASRNSSPEGQQEFSFSHGLIQDVCYSQIPRLSRVRRHRSMAAWIEATAERLDDSAEVLAHHYSTALELARATGSPEVPELETRARRVLVTAADRATTLDLASALSFYRQALELLGRDDPVRAHALAGAGFAYRYLGDFPEAEDHLKQAIEAYSKQGNARGEAGALIQVAILLRDAGRTGEGRALTERAVELLEQEPPGDELATAYRGMAFFNLITDALDSALVWVNKAVRVAEIGSNAEILAACLSYRGLVRCESGDLGGLEDIRRAADLSEVGGDAHAQMDACNNLADRIWLIEGPARGLELTEKAKRLGRSYGYLADVAWAQLGGQYMLFELGAWKDVETQTEELLGWARRHGSRLIEIGATLFLALIAFHRGDLRRVRALEDGFLPYPRHEDDIEWIAPALALGARIHACSGQGEEARALLEEFHSRTEQTPFFRARYLPEILRAAVAVEDSDQGRFLLEEDRVVYPRDRHGIATGHAIFAEAHGYLNEASKLHRKAALRWGNYGFKLEEGQALLGAGRCLFALGEADEAAPLLRSAQTIFSKLGARPLFQETVGYLKQAIALSS